MDGKSLHFVFKRFNVQVTGFKVHSSTPFGLSVSPSCMGTIL